MIKKIAVLSVVLFSILVGCGEAEPAKEEVKTEVKDNLSANPDYKAGLALVATSNCLTCHAINQTTTGPSYADIAAKYAGADDAQIATLAQKIIAGGVGNWGQVPMIPHPNVSEDDAKKMVKYILLLKK